MQVMAPLDSWYEELWYSGLASGRRTFSGMWVGSDGTIIGVAPVAAIFPDLPIGPGGAKSVISGMKLARHLYQTQKYGRAGQSILEGGRRIRYYGKIAEASKKGAMFGRRRVREWNTISGRTRTWMETLDHSGKIRIVRPETGMDKVHYMFNELGNYIGKW
jgi:hypothetical protein